ncbi:MAG TPA: SDR family NAD(P)-dependent oxidoreductase [Edaphobacter sp.]|nr:SDR family NAD(P)-dependent oxidoreductase [Edaphobacter sp.]
MKRLDGKIAVVTGGSSGIGFATAKAFVNEGATVYMTGRRKEALEAAAAKIGEGCMPVAGDTSKQADIQKLYEQIRSEQGRVDIVFANAGIAEYGVFGHLEEAQYERIFGTNVKGVIFSVQAALPLMPDGGSIILNGSVVGSKGLPAGSVYAATKAAIRSFARTWTTDLKERKIRVNVVSPGPIQTEGMEGLLGSGETGKARRELISSGSRSVVWEGRKRSLTPWSSSQATKPASSQHQSSSWMADSRRSNEGVSLASAIERFRH